jgi:hypothetical protein
MKSIIFGSPSIKAILRGNKTMTRRIVSTERYNKKIVPGDILVVRESWAAGNQFNKVKPRDLPPYAHIYYAANTDKDWEMQSNGGIIGRWRSPRYMPYAISRITLNVIDVRLEELQVISNRDMALEGVIPQPLGSGTYYTIEGTDISHSMPVYSFIEFWTSINGKGSWEKNPVVQVISFEVIETGKAGQYLGDGPCKEPKWMTPGGKQ